MVIQIMQKLVRFNLEAQLFPISKALPIELDQRTLPAGGKIDVRLVNTV